MAKPKIRLNSSGVRDMLKSAPVQDALKAEADRMAESAGPGYESSDYPWTTRGRASVITATGGARRDNSRNQTLARVLASRKAGS